MEHFKIANWVVKQYYTESKKVALESIHPHSYSHISKFDHIVVVILCNIIEISSNNIRFQDN